jgi:hypothetical protein
MKTVVGRKCRSDGSDRFEGKIDLLGVIHFKNIQQHSLASALSLFISVGQYQVSAPVLTVIRIQCRIRMSNATNLKADK